MNSSLMFIDQFSVYGNKSDLFFFVNEAANKGIDYGVQAMLSCINLNSMWKTWSHEHLFDLFKK